MKKIYFNIIFLFVIQALNAQIIFSEDFSEGSMPSNFTLVNLDGLIPDDPDLDNLEDSAWTVKNITSQGFAGGNCAFSVSWYENDEGPSDDWMILPPIVLGMDPYLTWDAMAITSSGNFRDQYQVFVSDGGGSIDDYILLSPVFDTGATGEEITQTTRSISLNDYANETVYIAFRNNTQPYNPDLPSGPGNGGNELAVDNIIVSQGPVNVSASLIVNSFDVELFPNPSNGDDLQLKLGNDSGASMNGKLNVAIYSALGQCVQTLNFNNPSSLMTLDVADFASGTYTIQLLWNNEVKTLNWMKK